MTAKEKLEEWLNSHTEEKDWLHQTWDTIAEQAGVSRTRAYVILPRLLADRESVLPSDILNRREEYAISVGRYGRKRNHLSQANLAKLKELKLQDPPVEDVDCAYLLGVDMRIVKHMIEKNNL